MGAGSFPAGVGGAGFDPAYVPPPPPPGLSVPVAIEYDPSTRSWVMNDDGTFAEIHPVDQQFAMLLTQEAGSVPSTPDTGMNFRKRVARADPADISAIAQDEVTRVSASMVANGDIAVLSITTDTSVPKRVLLAVEYRNLRLPPTTPTRTVKVPNAA